MTYTPRSLPEEVQRLCTELNATPRLVAHLRLVHDVACDLVEGLADRFSTFDFDQDAVLFGAASHDLGKTLHPDELTGQGNQHEVDGPALLKQHGVPLPLVRFARTHGAWSREELPLEDLLVSLSDTVWKGQRIEELESQLVDRIAAETGTDKWQVFAALDAILDEIASQGDERLAWQRSQG